jgi:xanthine dehydrogenase YagS FAD-binding subunit
MAVALAMYDARVVVLGADGPVHIPVTEFHRLPGDEPHRDTVLDHGQLITAVEIPKPSAGARSAYRKVRDRASYAFALVSVAAELVVSDGTITSVRIALGGVAHKPWRARLAEEALLGEAPSLEAFIRAAEAELRHAKPLPGNEFKVELARRTLVATLRDLSEEVTP